MITSQPKDIEQHIIYNSISSIPYVANYTTLSGEWSIITLGYSDAKQIILQPRNAIEWYYSTTSGGDYFTFRYGSALEANLVTTSGTTICWVKPYSDTIFELLVGR